MISSSLSPPLPPPPEPPESAMLSPNQLGFCGLEKNIKFYRTLLERRAGVNDRTGRPAPCCPSRPGKIVHVQEKEPTPYVDTRKRIVVRINHGVLRRVVYVARRLPPPKPKPVLSHINKYLPQLVKPKRRLLSAGILYSGCTR